MSSLPPLYTCCICNEQVDPGSNNSLRLAEVWLKSSGKTVFSVETELWRYRHNFCNPGPKQDSLF